MINDDISFCQRQARQHDYDRYIITLAAPSAMRGYLAVVVAFNDEIARIRDTVSEPALGDIRLAWWREAINEAASGSTIDHPVARAIAETFRQTGLDPRHLHAMIDARQRDLDDTPFQTLEELELYAEATAGSLAHAQLDILGVKDETAITATDQSATAWALIGSVRALDHHRRAGRQFISSDVETPAILRRAEDLILFARGQSRKIPRRAAPVLMTNLLADQYLARLKTGNNAVVISNFKKARIILWNKVLGRY